jgi:myo-inositol-1(or 4)-monophosphatase
VPDPSAEELLEVAIVAVRTAGAVLVERLGTPLTIDRKNERTSLVTAADLAAQEEIVRVITERYPHHSILGEEGDRDAGDRAPTWIVDPLDGTSNFAHGVPLACSSVAVKDADGVVAGAIFEPFREELFSASRGGGAWLGDQRLAVSPTPNAAAALVCTGVQSDDPAAVADFGRRIVELANRCRAVRCLGSPALCLAFVAAGRIDAFLEADSTYAWDVAAGALLIAEAGGRIDDLDGEPLNLGRGLSNVLASNGQIHEELRAIVDAAVSVER